MGYKKTIQMEWCTFGRENDIWKKKHYWFLNLNVLNMQKHLIFLLSFENANFAMNGKYFKKSIDNS
jgi:hypothetical protein